MGETPKERKRQISKPEGQLIRLWMTGGKTFHTKWKRFCPWLTTGGILEAPACTTQIMGSSVGGVTSGGPCGRSH